MGIGFELNVDPSFDGPGSAVEAAIVSVTQLVIDTHAAQSTLILVAVLMRFPICMVCCITLLNQI